MADLPFTGERYVARLGTAEISYEHWHRYLFAAEAAAGKRVLDIACGEGYGSAWLARNAARVVGVDIDPQAVAYARERYPRGNLSFCVGSVDAVPVTEDHSLDLIVCFETIEHVEAEKQEGFMREAKRLLAPGGSLMISTPNKKIYTDLPQHQNPFHVSEFYYEEFKKFIAAHFKQAVYFGQKVYPASVIWPLEQAAGAASRYALQWSEGAFSPVQAPLADMYDLAWCTDDGELSVRESLLVDLNERWIRECHEQMQNVNQALMKSRQQLELQAKKIDILQRTNNALTRQLGAASEKSPGASAAEKFTVSIVIPVFNRVEYTRACLDALVATTPNEGVELIVVDNASTDATPELCQALSGDVRVIRNAENLGFVRACNQGAAVARGKYLLFLNNDTVPQSGWLDALLRPAETDERVAAVGAKLVYPDGRLQEAGGIIFNDGSGWNFGRLDDPAKPAYQELVEVDYCSGACLLVRRRAFEQVDGFDLRYAPAYYEDTDLCFSLREQGYKVMYCPGALVVHCEGATAGTDLGAGFKRYQVINRKKFVEKWRDQLQAQDPPPSLTRRTPVTADRRRLRSAAVEAPSVALSADRAPAILVIDPILPCYDRASGSLRLFNVLKLMLALGWRVTYLARNGLRQETYKRELEAMGIEVYATDPEKMAKQGCPVDAPVIPLEQILRARRFDVAWLSFYHIAEDYLPDIRRHSPETRIVIDTVDVHFLREQRQAELQKDDKLRLSARQTRERELAIYAQAEALITVTAADREILAPVVPGKPIHVVPNIHDIKPRKNGYAQRQGLLFVGNFNHPPNADAVRYFCQDVFPKIQAALPDVQLQVVGAHPPEDVQRLQTERITVTGYVMDTQPYIESCRVSIAPLRFGAGMKGKVGEALAGGLPVVTTSMGAEGMGVEHDRQLLVADDAEGFAQAVIRLYSDPALWERLSQAGQDFMQRQYAPDAIKDQLATVLQAIRPPRSQKQSAVVEEPAKKDDVSMVMLTRNQQEYTRKCLESIFKHTQQPYEIIVVDNGSTDGTPEFIRGLAPQRPEACRRLELIANAENRGFAVANNQGLAAGRGAFRILLNNDVVVTPGWLERMLAVFQRSAAIGLVGPMSNCVSGPQQVPAPGYQTETLEGLDNYARLFARQRSGRARPSWRVVGFCMLIREQVIEKIGGLDPRFGLGNFEDDDFSLRASLAGFESWIAEDCFVHHFGSRTFSGERIDYRQSLQSNWEIFKRKWNLPPETPFGGVVDLAPTLKQAFQPKHYCALA
ncbi:MAG: glycosyltransferase [candidate division FCPU426 bacterium]